MGKAGGMKETGAVKTLVPLLVFSKESKCSHCGLRPSHFIASSF